MTPLTLFGKVMEKRVTPLGRDDWEAKVAGISVSVSGYRAPVEYWASVNGVSLLRSYPTPELARDDAEAKLRELYKELGEVLEPWRHDEPDSSGEYEVLMTELSERVECLYWENSTRRWMTCAEAPTSAPYAWRPMPKPPECKT